MAWDLPPSLGIGIPVVLIASIGYGGHLFIFHKYLTISQQIWFQFCLTMVWVSYLMAIYSDPGSPPENFNPSKDQWRKWCRKCQAYKPERTHHCKTCRKCVKQMDHHCPWIASCVGHDNLPHFLRFLIWVDYTNGYAFLHLLKRGLNLWKDRALPIYLISKFELVVVIFLLPLSFIVLFSVGLMTVRWLYALIFRGMTQVETWEYERIESNLANPRFIGKVKNNYSLVTGKQLQSILSWSAATRFNSFDDNQDGSDSSPFDSDDIIFPYDLNPLNNLLNTCGYPWSWVLPWGKPLGDGITFQKNEYYDGDESDLSSIPWPPDGNHDDPNSDIKDTPLNTVSNADSGIRKRTKLDREEWFNDYGDKLSDFGVDIDA